MLVIEFECQKVAMKRLVFDASKISVLKVRVANTSVPKPKRIEVVVALIWKCAMAESTSNLGGFIKPSVLRQVVNLRVKK
ncbi:hypothetical protein QQP08_006678 [Theobroma cacao]|nr:hypothetical protein QQP08_006678 [Theobroma cacao]